MTDTTNADQYGSDITQYAPVDSPGTGERIMNGSTFGKGAYGLAEDITSVVQGDKSIGDAAGGISVDLTMLAAGAAGIIKDPIFELVNAGLSVLLELVTPLNDILEWVSGDPGQMDEQQQVWGQVEEALGALSEEVGTAVSTTMPTWAGTAADAAYNELYGLSAAIGAMAHECGAIKQLLAWAEVVAQTIYAVIKALIAEFVSWAITRGLVALAASPASFGSSWAAFLVSAIAKYISAMTRTFKKMAMANRVFAKIAPLLAKYFVPAGKSLWKTVLMRAVMTAGITGGLGAATTGYAQASSQTAETGVFSAASPAGLTVDLDELDALASELDSLSSNGESIHSVATGAASEDMTWGITGLFFASSYNGSCGEAVEMTKQLGPACTGHAQRLRDCKEAYAGSDEAAVADFEQQYNQI
ncbi:hypothetical protein [Glycomyces sp. NPDC048151]|uniref:hypothetical protein n=1 Tax=Glycomyces sp. NPDC048151 TaxID=3364002 RepID=UPI00371ECBFB